MEMHERAIHRVGKKDEKKEKKRREKRAQIKLPKFEDNERREEFLRKQNEFISYSERTELVGEEITDDLYVAMSTSLKRKLLASSKVNKTSWKKTNPKVHVNRKKVVEQTKPTLIKFDLDVADHIFKPC